MAVIATFHLHDAVPSGEGPRRPQRVMRRLRAGVGEADEIEPEAVLEMLGHLGVRLARGDIQRASVDLLVKRFRQQRMAVTREERAEAHVEIDEAVSVQVPEVGTFRFGRHDGMRVVELERRGDARRHGLPGSTVRLLGPTGAPPVGLELELGDALRPPTEGGGCALVRVADVENGGSVHA